MDVEECKRNGLIKKTEINEELIISLVEMADSKEDAVKTAQINEKNISAYVSLAYDALRETLEAVCCSKGYKVLSHICIEELLRELIPEFDHETFDRIRWIRNGINYYGKKVDLEQGKKLRVILPSGYISIFYYLSSDIKNNVSVIASKDAIFHNSS